MKGDRRMEKPNRVATVGQLRAALEGIADDTPLIVNAADLTNPSVVDEQVITSTGFGLVDWGDGHGLEPDSVFALNCHVAMPDDDMRRRPVRPERDAVRGGQRPQAQSEPPVAEPEAEL
jgi:hypothetical protein